LQYNSNFVDAADYSGRFSSASGQQYSIDVPITNGAVYSGALSITYGSQLTSSSAASPRMGQGR
jgi:hypothetical protein